MNIIELENISKVYGKGHQEKKVLNDLSLKIKKGDFVGILGKSGSGKSTLLNIIGCLDTPTEGRYILKGNEVNFFDDKLLSNKRGGTFGFIVQNFALINEYRVKENIKVALDYSMTPLSFKEQIEKIKETLGILGIEDKLNRFPNELSGGEAQRVAIARAIIKHPDVLLADEPTGSLDTETAEGIMEILYKLNNEGTTIIMVTHNELTCNKCNRLIHMSDGKIVDGKDF